MKAPESDEVVGLPIRIVVFDCMIFLQAAARPDGPSGACFQRVRDDAVRLFVSQIILGEIRDVLNRPKILSKFPALTRNVVDRVITEIETISTEIGDVPLRFTLDRDPKDAHYVDLAIESGAHMLVSRDKDLLDLMDDSAFRDKCPGLAILDPVSFLRVLERPASN